MVASHAGITRTIRTAAERAKVWTIFNVVTPLCAKLMGYVPVDKLGVGKTIPLGVMLQWRRWAGRAHGFLPLEAQGSVAGGGRLDGAEDLGAYWSFVLRG